MNSPANSDLQEMRVAPIWKKVPRHIRMMLAFAGFGLIMRLLLLPLSHGCYTDGILQLDCFRQGASFWPPLFALLARLFAWIPGIELEGAGRLTAMLCGAALILPLGVMTRDLYGMRAATWAMAVWLASPMALRWSLQPMSDTSLTLLWTLSLMLIVMAVRQFIPGVFSPGEFSVVPNTRCGLQCLMLASGAGAMAALTRIQGWILLPAIIVSVYLLGPIARSLGSKKENALAHASAVDGAASVVSETGIRNPGQPLSPDRRANVIGRYLGLFGQLCISV